ncbi:hypothetical protein LPB137_05165 [Poseidonibacter parvus]|uniref:Uncharacterized protein n=1 Tax=Poseidonibacter parvus TaxID=1850254 RepID=A0A1P8KL58_9BACT|nr:NACHT domain-containing protein [Poseidonibacter parvus]APW65279.1 hypothetical protein LPB137_05165 [Poseidonibacter parvus]
MEIKRSAITYAGYEYQTLQGLLVLAYWLDNPNAFKRVCFEADQDDIAQGIDDIVIERQDSKIDYIQVKFTPSPYKEENSFSWDWLLKKTGKTARSRSILKKIFDAVKEVPLEKRGDITLLTNKIPNREIENCLKDGKIIYDFIGQTIQTEIKSQLGNEHLARTFFEILDIKDTQKNYLELSREVRTELEKHSLSDGIDRLINRAREWAKLINYPTENGWIELHHVREILSSKRAKPIPESFTIPENYCLPDKEFHNFLLNKVSKSTGEVISISGEPGKGKSTYLSYLFNELERLDIPVIRHHYFLPIDDGTHDRLSFNVIAESLIFQIKNDYKEVDSIFDDPEKLYESLKNCSEYYKNQEKPFVLIIDGLDHVWRDNHRDKKPLDYLFREILPLPDNLVLIVGTQPVDDALLPDILLEYSPKKSWFNLPSMSAESIYEYLNSQIAFNRLYMNCSNDMIAEETKSISIKLFEITLGYPLHVIYSCEYIANSGNPLSIYEIDKLPPCDDNNIESYYTRLWRNLTHSQKDILHLCAGFSFIWPRDAFSEIFGQPNSYSNLNAVSHLLYEAKSGVRPFHESLIVFVRKQTDHIDRILGLGDSVCTWLDTQAPEYLKESWLWLCQSKSGNAQPLRDGLSRDWVIERLSEGYNEKQLIQLFSNAESIAFNELNYSEAYKHRALKIRLINGPEFQTWNLSLLKILSFNLSPDSLINFELSVYQNNTPRELAVLSIALWNRNDFSNAKMIANQALSKYRSQRKLYQKRNNDDDTIELLVHAGVLSDELNYDNIFTEGVFENWDESLITVFTKAVIYKNDISLLIKAFSYLIEYKSAYEIELSLLKQSILEEFDIFSWEEFELNYEHPMTEFYKLLIEEEFNITTDNFHVTDGNFPYELITSVNYYDWFFELLRIKLSAQGDFCWLNFRAEEKPSDTTFFLNELTELASLIANNIINKNKMDFSSFCSLLETVSFSEDMNFRIKRSIILFKRDWIKISADLHLLINHTTINSDILKEAMDGEFYLIDWIRLWYTDSNLNLLTDEAANLLLEEDLKKQAIDLEETIERGNRNLELANIAFRHSNNTLFKKCIYLCWDYVIGYGHHKDTTIFHLLDSIEHLSNKCPKESLTFLKRIAPIIFNISDFTDGDETRHAKSDLTKLLAKVNSSILVSKYKNEVDDGEWYHADETLSELLKVSNFNSITTKRFCLTGLPDQCHETIINKANTDNPIAVELIEEINNLFNINILEEKETTHNTSSNSLLSSEVENLDPSLYPPENVLELDELIKNDYKSKDFWPEWYTFWVENGKEQELVETLPDFLSNVIDKFNYKACLYDNLFHSIKKFKGKKKAFEYLINAHIYSSGWEKWYSSEEDSFNRLDIVANIYPKEIDGFILKTTKQIDKWKSYSENLIIPSDRLVYLMVAADKKDEAVDLIESMLFCIENDVRNLNLKEPSWDWNITLTEDEIFINMLTPRLKWPVPTIKLFVLQQLSQLLLEKTVLVENALIKLLQETKQESEYIEILSILLLAKDFGYKPSLEFGNYINARSILSDMIIDELKLTKKGKYSTSFTPYIIYSEDDKGFKKVQGGHVHLIYKTLLQKEEDKTDIPFVDYYQSEWVRTFEYAPSKSDNIDYFFGSKRENTAQFYTNTTHRGRSAYLRTLEIAKQFYGMPIDYAKHLAIPALPIEPTFNKMLPIKSNWIANWVYQDEVNESNLLDFINQCVVNLQKEDKNLELGSLSFPFQIDENNWLDITIVKAVVCPDEIISNIMIEEKNNAICYGEKLDSKITYFCHELEKGKSIFQLTGTTYPISRFGHFYSDLETRGIYIPLTYDKNKDVIAEPGNGQLNFLLEDNIIGTAGYWYYKWEPTHPKKIISLCGTYTLLSKSTITQWINKNFNKWEHVYICKVSIIERDRIHNQYNTREKYFILEI